ncbi:MLP-like protein 43 [Benincasa hispida]|uniref:MLP-like protein 43 n=1 Tax=Benincasa hispida TaxID=102211 RepID=UPI00190016F3|nr:MLP-like protein 43 [Benincasa hispida]
MGVYGKVEMAVPIRASASKFHEIFKNRPHHISNVSTDKIQGVDLHEGEWGKVGSIITWRYFHNGKARATKEIVEAVDEENNSITFKVIGGDLTEKYKNFKFNLHCIPQDKGSVIHWCLQYEKLHDAIPDSHDMLDFCVDISKELDAHLLENNGES